MYGGLNMNLILLWSLKQSSSCWSMVRIVMYGMDVLETRTILDIQFFLVIHPIFIHPKVGWYFSYGANIVCSIKY